MLTVGALSSSLLAPLSLCSIEKFNLKDDSTFCPPERDALAEIFDELKGNEWVNISVTIPTNGTVSTIEWLDEYEPHCKWFGILCDGERTTKLELRHNGLAGRLSPSIGKLSLLQHLDLSDNDIKVRLSSLPPASIRAWYSSALLQSTGRVAY